MQRFLSLNKLILRRSSSAVENEGYSYEAFLRPLLRSTEPASFSRVLQEPFQQQTVASKCSARYCCCFFKWPILGRTYASSAAAIRSHLSVGGQSLKFFFQRNRFGAFTPYGFRRNYCMQDFLPGGHVLSAELRSSFRRYVPTSNEAVLGLIGVNIGVYLLWQFANISFMRRHFVISLENLKSGYLHSMLTSAFSHSEVDHLLTNMIGLYFFGTSISRIFGPAFLINLYVAGALGGSVFFLLHRTYVESAHPFYRGAYALGASAAVNSIILLDVFLFPKNIYYVNLIIPVPAMLMGAFIIGSDLWRIKKGDEYISGSAHMGGAFVALIAWAAVKKGWL